MKLFKAGLLLGVGLLVIGFCSLAVHASYQCLRLSGSGYASIADGSQAGLNFGQSDFIIEARIKSISSAKQPIAYKNGAGGYYDFHINVTTGFLECVINDGTNTATITGDEKVTDGRWHDVGVSVDKSSATGGQLFVDGTEDASAQTDVTSVLDIDNDGAFQLGYDGTNYFVGFIEEVRVWNFGYGGLPADDATYLAWRAATRNVFLDISNYDSDAWAGYADADRTEMVTDGGLENWTTTTDLTSWIEAGVSTGMRDITRESTEKHAGTYAAKLEATLNDGTTDFDIHQFISPYLTVNKYYEVLCYLYFASRTAGNIRLRFYNVTDGNLVLITVSATEASYTFHGAVFKPTVTVNSVWAYFRDESNTGVVYFDDISVKRTGLVGHWKLEGNYLDEGSNDNDLTVAGSGNTFPTYTLKRQKIISPASVN